MDMSEILYLKTSSEVNGKIDIVLKTKATNIYNMNSNLGMFGIIKKLWIFLVLYIHI